MLLLVIAQINYLTQNNNTKLGKKGLICLYILAVLVKEYHSMVGNNYETYFCTNANTVLDFMISITSSCREQNLKVQKKTNLIIC